MQNKVKKDLNEAIDRVEQKIGTDMRYVIKGGFWLTSSKVITAVASLITSIAFANLLPESDYGFYRYILSFVSIFTIATLSGIDIALVRSIGQGFSGSFTGLLKTKIKWGLLGGLLSIIFSVYYFLNHNIDLAIGFIIVGIFIPFFDSFYIYMSYLNGIKRYDIYNKYHLITKVLVVITLLLTVFYTKNILFIIFVYFFVHTLLRGIFAFTIIIKNKFESKQADKELISFGKHLTFMKILGIISTSIDKILVFHYLGAVALAGYYVALVPFKQIQGVLGSLNVLALPKFSSNNNLEEIKKTLPKKVLKSYIFIIPMIIVYILLADYAFTLIYPKYMEFVGISKIFMILIIFFPLTLFNTALTAMAKKKELYFLSTLSAIVRIVLLLILVPMFGLIGAIGSIIITNAVSGLSNGYVFLKKTTA
ncbi:oligosaccharide flippase family protein [Candidatus Nomurabacteria bacterium]|nr:oligosaccharide flippase family protein [Candidatus Nomurabacteria bacterium]